MNGVIAFKILIWWFAVKSTFDSAGLGVAIALNRSGTCRNAWNFTQKHGCAWKKNRNGGYRKKKIDPKKIAEM